MSMVTAVIKIGGIALFAAIGLWLSGGSFEPVTAAKEASLTGFLAATALGILAYKGFTTITNDGDELVEPKKNVSRAIVISIGICVATYALVALAVAGSPNLDEIVASKDYVLAEAARPALGKGAVYFTVSLAIVAAISGVIASVFAVSRMLAMLTQMKLVPHRHFGMPGEVQKHTLVYTVVLAIALTLFFDLSRIAALGAFFYLVMDIAIHWGVYRSLRQEIGASGPILLTAIVLDLAVLGALIAVKGAADPLLLAIGLVGFLLIFGGERWFLAWKSSDQSANAEPAS